MDSMNLSHMSYLINLSHMSCVRITDVKNSFESFTVKDSNVFVTSVKQVAQRATIAHLSPMCQCQISFKKNGSDQ